MALKVKSTKLKKNGEPRKIHPNSLANLIPYGKGENGNQQGYRTGYSLTARLKDYLDKPPTAAPPVSAPLRDHLAYSTIEGAIKREPTPLNLVWDRVDGKVPERHAILGDIVVEIVYRDREQLNGP